MYTPASFKQNDFTSLSELITNHPLGLLISNGDEGIITSPIPFLLRQTNNKLTLVAHTAKANKHWLSLQKSNECVVVFSGHENYITPSWYPTKNTTHKVVPTWNYQIIQIRGQATVTEDINWLRKQIEELTNQMEGGRENPWKVSDAPLDFIETQIKAIIGIEIEIKEINGKWKMSQNKSKDEMLGVIDGLNNPNDNHCNHAVASIIQDLKNDNPLI